MLHHKSSFLKTKSKINKSHHHIYFSPITKPNAQTKRRAVSTMGDKAIIGLLGRSQDFRTPVVPEVYSKTHEKIPCVNRSNPLRAIWKNRSNTQEIGSTWCSKGNTGCHKKTISSLAKTFLKRYGCCSINHIL